MFRGYIATSAEVDTADLAVGIRVRRLGFSASAGFFSNGMLVPESKTHSGRVVILSVAKDLLFNDA
jgi:hypothetical protein